MDSPSFWTEELVLSASDLIGAEADAVFDEAETAFLAGDRAAWHRALERYLHLILAHARLFDGQDHLQ
ncbi:hypothetical protein [Polymorphobacter megasporae]|uniref:hypothetical protein n=1 Tax=Glacieibacterium megasporae TaxID=2835787 RepID=UPI001C1E606E|nr:hypothetical protein [Polymorphobacter megasporae]UAJ10503.1 hypothetical protein KTC28_01690 [Polymorphobacter megasporae]